MFHWLAYAVVVGGLSIAMAACERDDSRASDASTPKPSTEPIEGTLFGTSVSSYVALSQGVVTKVGVRIPISAIEAAPADAPFQNDLVLDMPEVATQQTFLSQLRVNWLAHGHGPAPYAEPHFDFHFYRGSGGEIAKLVFIEPMITQATLLEKRDFELAITSPRKSGGASTRYPTLVRGRYDPDSASYRLEFDAFVELD